MVQLAGGVTAVQVKPMALEEEAVAASPVGAEGSALQLALEVLRTSSPMSRGWFTAPLVNAITIWPLLLAVAVKVLTKAAFSAPTVPTMSKLVSTAVLLMATSNSRSPAPLK